MNHASRAIEVVVPGINATIQDGGRHGQLRSGIARGGAMDDFARRLGNALLGNPEEAACVEIANGSAVIRAIVPLVLCLCGSDVDAHVAGQPVVMNHPFRLGDGEVLTLGRSKRGVYSYLCVAGGIDTLPFAGSRSTVVREGLGGLDGRTLRPGDVLPVALPSTGAAVRIPAKITDVERCKLNIRFLPGFHVDRLTDGVMEAFQAAHYRVTGATSRMAARLEGGAVRTGISQLYSEATSIGAIQIPPDGQPIVLLNDCQTMGGYPMLGAVIDSDCTRLAQAPVGTDVRFCAITALEADRVSWLERHYAAAFLGAISGTIQ